MLARPNLRTVPWKATAPNVAQVVRTRKSLLLWLMALPLDLVLRRGRDQIKRLAGAQQAGRGGNRDDGRFDRRPHLVGHRPVHHEAVEPVYQVLRAARQELKLRQVDRGSVGGIARVGAAR